MINSDGYESGYLKISNCRVCGFSDLISILNLGEHPLANSLRKDNSEKEIKIPLELCMCKNCKVAQLGHTVDPKVMFSNYLWVTGTSETTQTHAKKFCNDAKKILTKTPKTVLEIASNDGTFLKPFKDLGSKVFGIDPAENIAEIANKNNITTFVDFFSTDSFEKYNSIIGDVDFIFARNVLAHVPRPMDFLDGIQKFMGINTVGVVEFHYNKKIIDELHYDSIYHEHYFYYSIDNIKNMLSEKNLFIFDAMESPINKGNMTIYFSKQNKNYSANLKRLINEENKKNIENSWSHFAELSIAHKNKVKEIVSKYNQVIGFGSSARSSTLLNFAKINNNNIRLIADNNNLKHNRFTAGSNIKIVPPSEINWSNEKVVLVLAWNFFEEIKKYLIENNFNGVLIKPFPEIVSYEI